MRSACSQHPGCVPILTWHCLLPCSRAFVFRSWLYLWLVSESWAGDPHSPNQQAEHSSGLCCSSSPAPASLFMTTAPLPTVCPQPGASAPFYCPASPTWPSTLCSHSSAPKQNVLVTLSPKPASLGAKDAPKSALGACCSSAQPAPLLLPPLCPRLAPGMSYPSLPCMTWRDFLCQAACLDDTICPQLETQECQGPCKAKGLAQCCSGHSSQQNVPAHRCFLPLD